MREKLGLHRFFCFLNRTVFCSAGRIKIKPHFNLSTSMAICYSVMFYHTSNMYTTDKKFLINEVLESNENYLSGC